jgi:hypothetical protein
MIREEITNFLRLKGKEITLTVAKVYGSEETSHVYDVPVRSNVD